MEVTNFWSLKERLAREADPFAYMEHFGESHHAGSVPTRAYIVDQGDDVIVNFGMTTQYNCNPDPDVPENRRSIPPTFSIHRGKFRCVSEYKIFKTDRVWRAWHPDAEEYSSHWKHNLDPDFHDKLYNTHIEL